MSLIESKNKSEARIYQEILAAVRAGNIGLTSDIDGTLSPIALTPSESFVPEEVKAALEKIHASGKFKLVAMVSGRSSLDGRRLVGLPQLLYLGNHGMEALNPHGENPVLAEPVVMYKPLVGAALDFTRQNLLAHPAQDFGFNSQDTSSVGWENALHFEDKGITASIHYRLCPDPDLARQTILAEVRAVCANTGLVITEGRLVVEIRPPVVINKGTVLEDLALQYGLESLIFLGDDLTDVDAFLALRKLEQMGGKFKQGFSIGVLSPEMNPKVRDTADYMVDGVSGVAAFLNWLVAQL